MCAGEGWAEARGETRQGVCQQKAQVPEGWTGRTDRTLTRNFSLRLCSRGSLNPDLRRLVLPLHLCPDVRQVLDELLDLTRQGDQVILPSDRLPPRKRAHLGAPPFL